MSEYARLRVMAALMEEVGFRVMIRFDTQPRDLRWFRGLWR